MIRRISNDIPGTDKSVFWIDVSNPSANELDELANQYNLHKTSLKDCLDPLHLPKYEAVIETRFLILRHADSTVENSRDADTVGELTRKLALFILPNGIITIHRAEQKFLDLIYEKWKLDGLRERLQLSHLFNQITKSVFLSYQRPLELADHEFLRLEKQVLKSLRQSELLEQLYYLKGRVSVFKKMLRASIDAVMRVEINEFRSSPYYQDLKEEGDRQYFHADEMLEDVNSLLQTQLAIASHKTNEVMRILTLFSVFFLPLTFIVGVYGMNFDHMPELRWPYGYPAVVLLMVFLTFGILVWFRKKGWWGSSS